MLTEDNLGNLESRRVMDLAVSNDVYCSGSKARLSCVFGNGGEW